MTWIVYLVCNRTWSETQRVPTWEISFYNASSSSFYWGGIVEGGILPSNFPSQNLELCRCFRILTLSSTQWPNPCDLPIHLVSGIVHTVMVVQALPFINWKTPSNTLKLYEPRSPLAWDTRYQATTSAGTDALGRSALVVVCPLLLLLGWGRQSFSSLIIHENEILSKPFLKFCSSKDTKD